jgi:hypothetical protein
MLIERGVAELQHPIYGTIKAKPVGHIEREDDPVNKLGQSTVTVTFTETITDEAAAELNEVAADAIDEKYEEFSEAAAADFAGAIAADSIDTDNITLGIAQNPITDITDQLETQSALETQTQTIIDTLQPIASSDKKGFADWLATARELKDSIKDLYAKAKGGIAKIESIYVKALNIARLTLRLIKLPSDLSVALAEKIKGYSALTAALINQYKNDPFGIKKIQSAYATAALALTGVTAAIASGSALTVAEVAALTGAAPAGTARASMGSAASPGSGGGAGGGGTASGAAGAGGLAADKSSGTASREEAVEAANKVSDFFETTTAFQDVKIAQNADGFS